MSPFSPRLTTSLLLSHSHPGQAPIKMSFFLWCILKVLMLVAGSVGAGCLDAASGGSKGQLLQAQPHSDQRTQPLALIQVPLKNHLHQASLWARLGLL